MWGVHEVSRGLHRNEAAKWLPVEYGGGAGKKAEGPDLDRFVWRKSRVSQRKRLPPAGTRPGLCHNKKIQICQFCTRLEGDDRLQLPFCLADGNTQPKTVLPPTLSVCRSVFFVTRIDASIGMDPLSCNCSPIQLAVSPNAGQVRCTWGAIDVERKPILDIGKIYIKQQREAMLSVCQSARLVFISYVIPKI
jgi:hypothetical protein